MMNMTIFTADCRGVSSNTSYPHRHVVADEAGFRLAAAYDHVCAEFKNSRRSVANFLSADCAPFDNDNDHSDNPEDWIRPEDYERMFPGVAYVVVPSRSNMKPKGSRSARPRHHVYFPHPPITDSGEYKAFKEEVIAAFPFFDENATDAARFIYGNPPDEIIWHDGDRTIADLLDDGFAEWEEENSGIREGSRNSTMSRYAGRVIKRLGNTEEAHAKFLKKAEECVPPLGDAELEHIWSSAVRFWKKVSSQEGYVQPGDYGNPSGWEQPLPFDECNLPAFPVDALPGAVGRYAAAVAESTQTPVDLPAVSSLAVLSACSQKKLGIRAKDDWTEPVNLFCLAVMDPSERKSAVERAVTRPLNTYETKYNTQNAGAFETSKMEKRILERRQKAVEDQASKGKADAEELERIVEEVAGFRELKPMRLYVDDITTEKLTSVMADNDGRAAILSTEGGIFDMLAGTYSKNVNIDVMLKGYSGDTIRVDRIGRTSESILHPTLTVLLMAQPSVLSDLMKNNTFRGRGLTARFLYSMPASLVGSRTFWSAPVTDSVYRDYERLVWNLLDDECGREPEIITLSPEAAGMLGEFAGKLEPMMKREYAEISEWAGKLVGNVLRIAGLLCRASVYRSHDFLDEPEPLVVDRDTMANAIRIGEYFIEHAKAAFTLMGTDSVVRQSRMVLEAIKKKGFREFKCRDIMRLCRTFKKAEDVRVVLNRLIDYGYLAEKPSREYSGKGRPPAQTYLVNPCVYE